MKFIHLRLAIAVLLSLNFYASAATTHYVDVNGTNPVSLYTGWATAATNIQDAIDVANAGDFIVVSNGVYKTGGRAVYGITTNRVTVDKAVTIQSVNGPASTRIEGTDTYPAAGYFARCVYLASGATLSGFTLTNGATRTSGDVINEQSGGGVWCESVSAVVSNCVLTRCYARENGGGAYQGTLSNCILTNNTALYGGGACSNLLLNCTLTKNGLLIGAFSGGGGAYGCTLSNCLIVGNQSVSGGSGGGAAFSTLTSCVVSNNFAQFGGGVSFGTVNNSLISSNRALSSGGGAYSNILNNCVLKNNLAASGGGACDSAMLNCTVVSNYTTASGSGNGGGFFGGSASNSIVCHNIGSSQAANYSIGVPMYYCCTYPLPTNGVGNITNEPLFVNLTNDFHLQTNSPCINAGNNSYVTGTTDFDGNPRIVGGTVDMGAYEFQSPASIISYAWLQQYGLPTDGSADFLDSDGDGMNNWQEWHAGTNPTNASSVLALQSPATTTTNATITWQSVSGINYFVQRGSDLSAQPPFSTIQSNIVGQAGTTSYTDTTATNGNSFFYRVGVQ